MHDPIFRGQSIVDKRWVYGDLMRENIYGKERISIWKEMSPQVWRSFLIDPATVGFSFLHAGRKIFAGDLIAVNDVHHFEVKWDGSAFKAVEIAPFFTIRFGDFYFCIRPEIKIDVTGTIYDK